MLYNIIIKFIPNNKKKSKCETKITKNTNNFLSFVCMRPPNRICHKCTKCFQKNDTPKKYMCDCCKIIFTNKHKKKYIFLKKEKISINKEYSFTSDFDDYNIYKSNNPSENSIDEFEELMQHNYMKKEIYETEIINKKETFCNQGNSPDPHQP
jgi:hypothetical protein